MKRFLITYDLIKNKDYKKLIDKLTSMHATKELLSAWSLSSSKTSEQLLEEIKPYIDADDKLKVFEYVDRADHPATPNLDNFLRFFMGTKPKSSLSSLLSEASENKNKK